MISGSTSTITIADGVAITIQASCGTQAIGWSTGKPVDSTEEGPIAMVVRKTGASDVLGTIVSFEFPNTAIASVVCDALASAIRISTTRDRRDDEPYDDAVEAGQ